MSNYNDEDDSQSSFEEASWPGGSPEGEGRRDSWDDVKMPEITDLQARAGDDCATVKCGECGKLIFDDTPRCPYCGFMQLEASQAKRPWWFVATVIFLVLGLSGVAAIVAYFKLHGAPIH